MKTIFICLMLCLVASLASAGGMVIKKKAAGGADTQITTYFNCDVNTDGTAMTKGTGVTAYTSDFSTVAGIVGNALYRAGGNGYQFQIPTASNWSGTLGTMGFFWRPSVIAANSSFAENDAGSSPYFHIGCPSTTSISFLYMNTGAGADVTIAANNTYWIEVAWDYAGARSSIRVYNVTSSTWIVGTDSTWQSQSGLTGSAPTGAGSINFGNLNGNQNTQWFDQIMIANVYQKDLFSVRTSTSP